MRDDLLELFVEVVEALEEAHHELVTLEEMEVPLPDDLRTQLEERDAMAATLTAVTDPELRAQLVASYREHMAKANRYDDAGKVSVSGEVLRTLEAVEESIRRRCVLVRELDLALRGALVRGDFAGC